MLVHQLGSRFAYSVRSTDPNRWVATRLQLVLSKQSDGSRVVLQYVPGNTDVGQRQPDGSVQFVRDQTWSVATLSDGLYDVQLLEGTNPQRAALIAPGDAYLSVVTPTGSNYTVGT